MDFNPSILITIAVIITAVGIAVGSYALFAQFRENKAVERVSLLQELTRILNSTPEPKTLSDSSVHVSKVDASRVQRVS